MAVSGTMSGQRRAVVAPIRRAADRSGLTAVPVRCLPAVLAVCFAALYVVVSVLRHNLMFSRAFDLGIFEQVVRGYSSGAGPVADLKGPAFNILGDHFSPVLASLAPVYHVAPYASTLLVAQALLLACSIVPLAGWALRAVGERAAWVVGICVGASWGLAQAVGFDFHEIAFAVPLLAFSLVAIGEGRLRAAALWAAPLVLVKEDLGLTVAVIGALIAVRGGRRVGLATTAFGLLATAVTLLVLIPWASPQGDYAYWGKVEGRPLLEVATGMLNPTTVATVILLLAPTAFLALRSSLLWVAMPTLLWRFASDNPAYHGTDYHYSTVLVPIVMAAFVEALRGVSPRVLRRALVGSLAVTLALVPFFPLRTLFAPPDLERAAAVASARRALAMIPDGATVAASNLLAPQLTDRTTVSLFGAIRRPSTCPQYIAVDNNGIGRWLEDDFPSSRVAQTWLYYQARAQGYGQIAADPWVTVLRYTGIPDPDYINLVADGPPAYLTDPSTGGTEDARDFVWNCADTPSTPTDSVAPRT